VILTGPYAVRQISDEIGPSLFSVDAEEERLQKLISELKDKSISDLIAEGSKKLASVPSGGGGGGAAAAAPAAGGAAAAEAPKEEAKAEEKEESDDDMGFGLFD
jgi:large subunit ribosomal protein LP2